MHAPFLLHGERGLQGAGVIWPLLQSPLWAASWLSNPKVPKLSPRETAQGMLPLPSLSATLRKIQRDQATTLCCLLHQLRACTPALSYPQGLAPARTVLHWCLKPWIEPTFFHRLGFPYKCISTITFNLQIRHRKNLMTTNNKARTIMTIQFMSFSFPEFPI